MKRIRKYLPIRRMLCLVLSCAVLTVAGRTGEPAYGAISGSGSREDPVSASPELKNGEQIAPGAWFWKLSGINGKELPFQAVFEPRVYGLVFHANGGSIPGSGETKTVNVRYNDGSGAISDTIQLPETPLRQGYRFLGWYLKGNEAAGAALLTKGSRYMIALEDGTDRGKAEVQGEKAVARALWRSLAAPDPGDENGPDLPTPGTDPEDSWSEQHSHNFVIEKRTEAPDKKSYRRLHGKTAYQYGRILFDAGTSQASSYRWYVNGTEQRGSGATFLLKDITRELNGAVVRCEVRLSDGNTEITHQTRLTVFYLPEIVETAFSFRAA